MLLAGFVCASCAHEDEEDTRSESKIWYDTHYNYPVFIDIRKDSLKSSIISTEIRTVGGLNGKTVFAGIAKDLIGIEEEEFVRDLERSKQHEGYFPMNDNLYFYLYFADTFMKAQVDPICNTLIIE